MSLIRLTPRRLRVGVAILAALALAVLSSPATGPWAGVSWAGGAPRVFAHAAYDRSDPAFAAELSDPPDRLDLWFNQELFRQDGANTITLADADGVRWPTAQLIFDPDDRRHVFVTVADSLPAGRYFLAWTNLSADDGDDDAGRSVFYVGRSPSAAEIIEDRALAAELLIPYPPSLTTPATTVTPSAVTDSPPPPRPVAIAQQQTDGGIDARVIGFAVVSLIAMLGLIATQTHRGRSFGAKNGPDA